MNRGNPWPGSRIKVRGTEVLASPIPWPQVSSREAMARSAAAGPERVAEAVVAVVAANATAKAINIIISRRLYSPLRSIISSNGLPAPSATSAACSVSKAPTAVSESAVAAFSAAVAVRTTTWRVGTSRVCFRCGQPRYFYSECRAIPPAPLNTYPPAPLYTTQQGDVHAIICLLETTRFLPEQTTDRHNNIKCPRRRSHMDRRYPPTSPGTPRPTGL